VKGELEDIRGGSARTWQNFYDLFWTIGTVRYVTYKQLKKSFGNKVWCRKCVTPRIIESLAKKDYINITSENALTITSKTLNFLETYAEGINTSIIKLPQGKGDKERIDNTDVLLKIIQLPDFYALFYPEFYRQPSDNQPFLVPDAALVLKREDKAKLIFLEIERPKGNWEDHLLNKKSKYETVARNLTTYNNWAFSNFQKLKIKLPDIDKFCFSILCIGDIRYDWPGWEFKRMV
jgi:hypothetical protein